MAYTEPKSAPNRIRSISLDRGQQQREFFIKTLFSWEHYEIHDITTVNFSEITLNRDIGDFKLSDSFDSAWVSFYCGSMCLTRDDQEFWFQFDLTVVQQLNFDKNSNQTGRKSDE